jgi:L-ectoine synthase
VIVRTLDAIRDTEREVTAPTFCSRRLLLAGDGLDFSLHDTVLYAGSETQMWYQHHVEAVYCIEGEGTLHDLDADVTHEIRPGTLYVLDGHERHVLRATTQLRMLCVFDPPCTGREIHDEHGTYPLLTEPAGADAS